MKEIAPDMEIVEYATKFTREDGQADFADILTSNDHIDAVTPWTTRLPSVFCRLFPKQTVTTLRSSPVAGAAGVLQHDEGKREHLD